MTLCCYHYLRLSYEMRAKDMAFSNLAVFVGGLLNQFAWPVVSEHRSTPTILNIS